MTGQVGLSGGAAARVRTTAKSSSALLSERQTKRGRRFELREKARGLCDTTSTIRSEFDPLTGEVIDIAARPLDDRFLACGRRSQSADGSVGVKFDTTKGAGYSGLHTCGSAWACPVCASNIQQERGSDLGVVTDWARREAKTIALATFTVRHKREDSLTSVWDAVSAGWGAVTSGSSWVSETVEHFTERLERWEAARALAEAGLGRYPRGGRAGILPVRRIGDQERFQLLGWARATEVTHSRNNGWHVHIHVLLVLDGPKMQAAKAAYDLADRMWDRWALGIGKVTNAAGEAFDAIKSNINGDVGLNVRVSLAAEKRLAEYLQKDGFMDGVSKDEAVQIRADLQAPGRAAARETVHGGSKVARSSKGRTPFQILDDCDEGGPADNIPIWREWVRGSLGRRQLTTSEGLRELAQISRKERSDEEIAADDLGGELVVILPRKTWAEVRSNSRVLLDVLETDGLPALLSWLSIRGLAYDVPTVHDETDAEKRFRSRDAGKNIRYLVDPRPELHA